MECGSRKNLDNSVNTEDSFVANGETYKNRPVAGIDQPNQRKLILHFDVRNTILVADSVTNILVEQALNTYLTGVVWGKEVNGEWCWYSEKPSLSPPCPGVITYYKHLEQKLVKVPSDRATLRQATGDFTQVNIGAKFAAFYKRHLECLEWEGGDDYEQTLTMRGKDGKRYHYILPSYFKLIQYLYESKRDFAIIIRTYGWDAANVLASTHHSLNGNHPMFQGKAISTAVNMHPGKVTRIPGQIRFETISNYGDSRNESKKTVSTTDRSIYNMLTESKDICAYVDDFLHWQDNSYNHNAAKPLWLNPYDKDVHHIFFDDNIRVTDTDSIVDLKIFDSPDVLTARSLSLEEIKPFEDMCLVQADLLESTSNIDYFIQKVHICEKKYTQYLQNILHK